MNRLAGKVALITGVGSGIGRAAAILFAREGAQVLGVDRNDTAGKTLAAELQQENLAFQFYAADLSSWEAAIAITQHCQSHYGRVDILYNNAGVSILEPFVEVTEASLEKILAVNFKSVFYLCQQVIPLMLKQGNGVVINTASELAIVAQPLYSAYCASKGAVLSLTRALALEYAQHNIRINALCPGPIDTPMLNQEFEQANDSDLAKAEGIKTMPIGRLGQPEEIAQVALYLASEAPALMHGASIVVDGGKTIV